MNNLFLKFKKLYKKIPRKLKISFLIIIVILLLPIVLFNVGCSFASYPEDVVVTITDHVPQSAYEIEDYRRTEESAFLTLPEWYTVFSYQEYAIFLEEENKPSGFPYFSAVNQYWYSYCKASKIESRNYDFNFEYNTMLYVIGVSFTIEYYIKGIYENTVGRITEFVSYSTSEDRYNAKVAKEYADFLPKYPWYQFSFGSALKGLWIETPLFGKEFLRKIERKFIISLELGIEAIYGQIIKMSAYLSYGGPDPLDYLTVTNTNKEALNDERITIVEELANDTYIISTPHYQEFTDVLLMLAREGASFTEISGNDEITLTVLSSSGRNSNEFNPAQIIYRTKVVIDKNIERIALKTKVNELGRLIIDLEDNGIIVEHIYDY